MPRFSRDMMTYATADLLGASIGLLLSPISTRLYSPMQYGAQAALAAAWTLVALAQYAGMDSAYPAFRARTTDFSERRRLLVSASLVAFVAVGLVVALFACFGLGVPWLAAFGGVNRAELFAFCLTLAPAGILSWILYLLRYEGRAAAFSRVSLSGRVVSALLVLPVLAVTAQEHRLWVGWLVTAAVTTFAAYLGWRELKSAGLGEWRRDDYEPVEARRMVNYGLVLVPGAALYAVGTVADRLMLTWLGGPEDTAVLALALRIGAVAVILKTWFARVWDPQLVEWVASLSERRLKARLDEVIFVVALVAGLVACLAIVWTEPLAKLLYPEPYWTAIPLVPWIVFGAGISALSLIAVVTTTLARTPRLHLPVYGVGLLCNVGVAVWLVPQMGAQGAVAAVVAGELCILAGWILIGLVWLRNLRLSWWRPLILFAVVGLALAIYRPGVSVLGNIWVERSLLTITLAVVAGWMGWRGIRRLQKVSI